MVVDEFKALVKKMKSVYAQPGFIPDKAAFDTWYELLKDLPYKAAQFAAARHMMTNRFPPTIADIREGAAAVMVKPGSAIGELEAWAMVYRAVCNSNYHAREEFDRLPETVRAAVGSPANLEEWAMMDADTVNSVAQSHFIRAFRAATAREEEMRKLSLPMQRIVERALKAGQQAALEQQEDAG